MARDIIRGFGFWKSCFLLLAVEGNKPNRRRLFSHICRISTRSCRSAVMTAKSTRKLAKMDVTQAATCERFHIVLPTLRTPLSLRLSSRNIFHCEPTENKCSPFIRRHVDSLHRESFMVRSSDTRPSLIASLRARYNIRNLRLDKFSSVSAFSDGYGQRVGGGSRNPGRNFTPLLLPKQPSI